MAKIYTIPNIITFVRIILIPIILYLLFSDNSKVVLVAGLLFIVSSISDYFDGYLASLLTGISVFNLAKNSLKPEIAISLNKIIIAGITWISAITLVSIKTMMTAAINSLSAIGSSKVPSFDD